MYVWPVGSAKRTAGAISTIHRLGWSPLRSSPAWVLSLSGVETNDLVEFHVLGRNYEAEEVQDIVMTATFAACKDVDRWNLAISWDIRLLHNLEKIVLDDSLAICLGVSFRFSVKASQMD